VAGHCALVNMDSETTFVLVRTNKSRGGGDDDYDVCDGEKVIGRIVRHPQAPKEAPWFWTIIAEGRKRSLSDRGMPLAASKQWRNFGRNGPATTLFAIASPTFQSHRCPGLSFVAFGATPKFGSP
jgi:hypothetical protein